MSNSWRPHGLQHAKSFTVSGSLLKFVSVESVMPSNHLILCCPLLLLHSVFPSIRAFSCELTLHIRWPKYWSFSFSMSPSSEYSQLISFRIDWFDLLSVQGTVKSLLLQHHNSKALNLQQLTLNTIMLNELFLSFNAIAFPGFFKRFIRNIFSFQDDCRVVLAKQEITRLLEALQKQQQQFTEIADHIQLDASIPVTFTKVMHSVLHFQVCF